MLKLNDRIIVISELDSIYIFNKDLDLLNRRYLREGNGRIYSEWQDKIVIYYPRNGHEFVEINEEGDIMNVEVGIENKSHYSTGIILNENYISEGNGIFLYPNNELANRIFDVDEKVIAMFVQDRDSLRVEMLFFDE